jgi:hypothetical protein
MGPGITSHHTNLTASNEKKSPTGVTMTFEPTPDGLGITTISGTFDQAALRGLLSYLWDMNLTVLSVDASDAQG